MGVRILLLANDSKAKVDGQTNQRYQHVDDGYSPFSILHATPDFRLGRKTSTKDSVSCCTMYEKDHVIWPQ